jgi:hypothetical protein
MPHGFLHLPGVYDGARNAVDVIGRDLRRLAQA